MIRGLKMDKVESWMGLDSFTDKESVMMDRFVASSNIVISPNGNALALRSPANVNDALSTSNPVMSSAYYDRIAGPIVLYDINASSGANVATYSTTGSTNTSRRTGQADAKWFSLNVDDRLFRVNGSEFIQYVTGLTAYAVGISAPASAPSLSIVAGGSGTLATGVIVSYAYRNSTTGHVGLASAQSSRSSTTGGGSNTLRIPVTASVQSGVDGIVIFITEDGGSIPYLYVDSNGDPVVSSNSTANIDISVANIARNNRVEETQFNTTPPTGATHLSKWKGRVMMTGFSTAARKAHVVYSGYDQIPYGSPFEAWPPLNVVPCPNRSERMRCGIETDMGWLGLSERDGYLLTGNPADKVDAGENTLQVTEDFDPMGWTIGTRSHRSLKNTPYGPIWFDQNKRLRLWRMTGRPMELCPGLRAEFDAVLETDAARDMVEGEWFDAGEDCGFYVLTACTSGSTNNKLWIITIIERDGQILAAGCPSDIAAQCLLALKDTNGAPRFWIGVTDRLREILDFDLAGAGWGASQSLYFEVVSGNHVGLFNTLQSVEYSGVNADNVLVQVRNLDDSDIEAMESVKIRNQYIAEPSPNRDDLQHKLRFVFPTSDSAKIEIGHLTTFHSVKKRTSVYG